MITDIIAPLVIVAIAMMLFITNAMHYAVVALLLPVLAVLTGIFTPAQALAPFANPTIFLFLGGFALATALKVNQLDRFIALKLMNAAQGNPLRAVFMLFTLTFLLSMWISNTASAALMLPLAMGMVNENSKSKESQFLFLGIAYSASLGGISTIVGTPANSIAAATTGITFSVWMLHALPVALGLFALMLLTLYLLVKPANCKQLFTACNGLPPWDNNKTKVALIFAITSLLWIFGKPIRSGFGFSVSLDSIVGLFACIALVVTKSVTWKQIEKNTNWGILLLFGGGLLLGNMLKTTGTDRFLAEQLIIVTAHISAMQIVFLISGFVVTLTTIMSNTATAALFIPFFVSLAPELDLSPAFLATLVASCSSCAFMLPISTPSNALVFGTGKVTTGRMICQGFVMSVLCAVLLPLMLKIFI